MTIVFVAVVAVTVVLVVLQRVVMSDDTQAVMVMVATIWQKRVQAITQERDAGIGGQQETAQEVAIDFTHSAGAQRAEVLARSFIVEG